MLAMAGIGACVASRAEHSAIKYSGLRPFDAALSGHAETYMRDETAANRALELYADTVRRVCFLHLNNDADVEDVFQDVFLKYLLRDEPFSSDSHEKAWLIRVAINACHDLHKSYFRKNTVSMDSVNPNAFAIQPEEAGLLEQILSLKPKYRDVLYLFYYEGYSAVEIADIMGKKVNTVYSWLNRAREQLKMQLGGEDVE